MRKLRVLGQSLHQNKLLFIILFVAIILRFAGTYPGYSQYHSDEPVVYGVAVNMVKNSNFDPGRYDYPAPVMVIQALSLKLFFVPAYLLRYYILNIGSFIDGLQSFPLTDIEYQRVLQEHVFGAREINALYWGRFITALFGFGNVVIIYFFSKKLFDKPTALLSALFLTFNFKHVVNSHLNLPDIYNSFFLLLSLMLTINLWKHPSKRNYLIAGIACGVSVAIKYQIYAALTFGIVQLLLLFDKPSSHKTIAILKSLSIATLTGIVVFLILNPYLFINFEEALRWSHIVFDKYGAGTNLLNLFPVSYIYHYDLGPALFFMSILGIVLMIKEWRKLVILLPPIVYYCYLFCFSTTGGFYIRNIILITPFLLISAAYSSYLIIRYLDFRLQLVSNISKIVFICLLLYIPARNSITNVIYNLNDWNFRVMADWLQNNLPSNALIAATPTDIPGGPKLNKSDFNLDGNFSLNEHKEVGAQYALLNTDWASGNFYYWMNFGNDKLDYWNKPWNELRNSFHGIAAEEIIRYQVYSATKPWQAPDSNLVVSKIPEWPQVEMQQIEKYEFSGDSNEWITQDAESETFVLDHSQGNEQNGAMEFNPRSGLGRTLRIISPLIDVKEGYYYEVSAYLKSERKLESRERQGFVRIDFIENAERTELGKISSVSSRLYGSDVWVNKKVSERAPKGSKYMVVSFQISHITPVKLWVDDVEVFESLKSVDNLTDFAPYDFKPVDLNVLYPNSHGNL